MNILLMQNIDFIFYSDFDFDFKYNSILFYIISIIIYSIY